MPARVAASVAPGIKPQSRLRARPRRLIPLATAKGRIGRDDSQKQYEQCYRTPDNGDNIAQMYHHRPVEILLNDRIHDEAEDDGNGRKPEFIHPTRLIFQVGVGLTPTVAFSECF